MKFDTIIIGGGLSGLTCAAMLAKNGQKVGLVTAGQSTLHFNSGSLELLGYQEGKAVENPLEAMKQLNEGHPYRKIKAEKLENYIDEAEQLLAEAGLKLKGSKSKNHLRLSPIGTTIPAWLTLDNLLTLETTDDLKGKKLLLANIEGFLDWPVPYLLDSLQTMGADVKEATFTTKELEFARNSPTEMRATNIAKYLNKAENVTDVAHEINRIAADYDMVLLPAVLGLTNDNAVKLLRETIQTPIEFVATMPPSVPGTYIQNKLRAFLQGHGAVILNSDTVEKGCFEGDKLTAITTEKLEETRLTADQYVLATGSFISGGLVSNYLNVSEPAFNLDVEAAEKREDWTAEYLFDEQHYMAFGVKTDGDFHVQKAGKTIQNLYAIGSVLSGNSGMKQANRTGVSMLTAIAVAHNILNK